MEQEKVAELLKEHVADAALLNAEAKAWHWLVTGPSFAELHALFEQVATNAREATDVIAERICQLGGRPPAFPAEWLEHGDLNAPDPGAVSDAPEMLAHLDKSLTKISRLLRDDLGRIEGADPASTEILTDWLRVVEKDRWMVRASHA